jgi:hypothetical protein
LPNGNRAALDCYYCCCCCICSVDLTKLCHKRIERRRRRERERERSVLLVSILFFCCRIVNLIIRLMIILKYMHKLYIKYFTVIYFPLNSYRSSFFSYFKLIFNYLLSENSKDKKENLMFFIFIIKNFRIINNLFFLLSFLLSQIWLTDWFIS